MLLELAKKWMRYFLLFKGDEVLESLLNINTFLYLRKHIYLPLVIFVVFAFAEIEISNCFELDKEILLMQKGDKTFYIQNTYKSFYIAFKLHKMHRFRLISICICEI